MTEYIIAIYVIVDDILKANGHKDDPRAKMSDAEVITTFLVAAYLFGGNIEKARKFLRDERYIPNMLSKSRLIRRIHKLKETIEWMSKEVGRKVMEEVSDKGAIWIADTQPLHSCQPYRRSKRLKGKIYVGKDHKRNEYFVGVKVGTIIDPTNYLVVFSAVLPASRHDINLVKLFYDEIKKTKGATIIGDKAFISKQLRQKFAKNKKINLLYRIRENMKGVDLPKPFKKLRMRIESFFSSITTLLPRYVAAVSAEMFFLKALSFPLVLSILSLARLLYFN